MKKPEGEQFSYKPGRHAVVVGGSMAGLLAARVLSESFDQVTIVERDRFPDGPTSRRGVPQSSHVHVLLMRGLAILEELLPGLRQEMARHGAISLDTGADLVWLTPFGLGKRFHSGLTKLAFSRDLLDWIVRKRLSSLQGVEFLQESEVVGLLPDRGRVRGIRLRGRGSRQGQTWELESDLVLDASGRGSRMPSWLSEAGWEGPRKSMVNPFLGYVSRVYRTPGGFAPDWKAVFVQAAPPTLVRAGVLFPIEGNRWIVTLAGAEKDYPPEDQDGYLEFARSLPSPLIHEFVTRAEPLSAPVGYRATQNRRHHYEELRSFPANVVVLGDAACCFNPVYGQGITTAALQVLQLRECLRKSGSQHGWKLAHDFHRRLAKVIETPWMMATSEDCRYPSVEGGRLGRASRWVQAYMDRVVALTVHDEAIRRSWLEVFHMLRPPSALFRPKVLAAVFASQVRLLAKGLSRSLLDKALPTGGNRPAGESRPESRNSAANGRFHRGAVRSR